MSTFDYTDFADADVRNMPLMTEEEQFACFLRFCRDAHDRHALREPYRIEADRCYDALRRDGRPRTALPMLGPWAPPEEDFDDLEIHGGTIVSGSSVPEDGEWILCAPREEKRGP